jgi:hypothetical protein
MGHTVCGGSGELLVSMIVIVYLSGGTVGKLPDQVMGGGSPGSLPTVPEITVPTVREVMERARMDEALW